VHATVPDAPVIQKVATVRPIGNKDLPVASQRIEQFGVSCEPPLHSTVPPAFDPHRWIRGGHLQTLLSLRSPKAPHLRPKLHWVTLDDGDQIALHDDMPPQWQPGDASLMLVHGLCGCRLSPYMIRLADQFTRMGVRVFRLEMRGCGVAADHSRGLTHAGRSDDCLAAITRIAELTGEGDIATVGISLGGNQLLRAAGRLGAGLDNAPDWAHRWTRLVAVSPPIDLQRCSDNLQRPMLRGYNRYFIGNLLRRLPQHIRQSPELMQRCARPWPKTLRELDDRITAPISGFRDAEDYYDQSSAGPLLSSIAIPSLILTAANDPIVPVECFTNLDLPQPSKLDLERHPVRLLITPCGGHIGFFARGRERFYMDRVIRWWCAGDEV